MSNNNAQHLWRLALIFDIIILVFCINTPLVEVFAPTILDDPVRFRLITRPIIEVITDCSARTNVVKQTAFTPPIRHGLSPPLVSLFIQSVSILRILLLGRYRYILSPSLIALLQIHCTMMDRA